MTHEEKVRDAKPKDMETGLIYDTKNNGRLEVVSYEKSRSVLVRFLDTGFEAITESRHIREGNVKDNLRPRVFGVGYMGNGKYKAKDKGKSTDQYETWKMMLQRCYYKENLKSRPTYAGCSVCDEWHNFQNFAEWYDGNHPNDGFDYDLDKDIKVDGNKVYSPSTCLFVSRFENSEKSKAKEYKFKNPKGDLVKVYNLAKFCRDNSLHDSGMNLVHQGKQKSHKGWIRA